jgi:nucleoside-diphosphate-sugar epimerase
VKVLVTGSSGHLGEALMRTLPGLGHEVVGIDILPSPFTTITGSIADRATVDAAMQGVEGVLHTATLHKPHVISHSRQDFVDVNITGTLNLLEAAVANNVRSFVYTSTTSTFGDSLTPPRGAPAAWITEGVVPIPKNIYGATKTAAEDLCQLASRNQQLPVIVLRTSRFFPEDDDLEERRDAYAEENLKANEFLYRRVEIVDVVSSHLCALEKAPALGFDKFIITATAPFSRDDAAQLGVDAPGVVAKYYPDFPSIYSARGWEMLPVLDRVYVNTRALDILGWRPEYDFGRVLADAGAGRDIRSPLAIAVGAKGYHPQVR